MKLRPSSFAWLLPFLVPACSDFDTTRVVPPRGSIGVELYSVICDRVGSNSLREDVTGASYHGICHPDATGAYATMVDASVLVPLDPAAVDENGNHVPLAVQQMNRAYNIARVEALGARRTDMVGAFNAAFPPAMIPVKDLGNADPAKTCNAKGTANLQSVLGDVLGRFTDMENDRTIPLFTEGLARILNGVTTSPAAQASLTHFDARQGYRPSDIALGAARPILSYPQIVDLANAFFKLLATDSDPYNPAGAIDPSKPLGPGNRRPIPGKASAQFQQLLTVLREELRTATTPAPVGTLTLTTGPQAPVWQSGMGSPVPLVLSRPRSILELSRELLLHPDLAFDDGMMSGTTRFITQRDSRGFAAVPSPLSAPFVDMDGDGLPDLDDLGQFVTTAGSGPVPSPFFSVDGTDGPRDSNGRATSASGAPLFVSVDNAQTFLAAATRDIRVLTDPAPANEAVMKLLAGAPLLFGARDATATSTATYNPDPTAATNWALQHPNKPAPAGINTSPVVVNFRAFHTDGAAPLVDLIYALGQLLADPSTDDMLQLSWKLLQPVAKGGHPNELARLIGLGLKIKELADQHPEAHIPASSTMWDELLDAFGQIAHAPGVLEDLIRAFEQPGTAALQQTFAAYTANRDVLSYDPNDLNGAAFNQTTNAVSPLVTPVNRALPDVGDNRSALQKFMQLLHDANGLAACTKDGAVVPIVWNGLQIHYPPQNLLETAALGTVCAFTGNAVPTHLNQCGILRIPNVASLLLDVALNRANFDVRDPCLAALVNSPLTGIVGGTDAFLQSISGVNGFDTHPTVAGISRMVYVNTPHDGLPGDTNAAMQKTVNFFAGVLDPVPTMVCPAAPFTDPSDGTVVNLRKCASFADTIRGRDANALFPLEQNNFIANVQALAAAFANHNQSQLFVNLFDVLHRHWGSAAQPKDVCDPTLPKTDARWCSQDGAVTYEPLFVDIFTKTDLLPALLEIVPILDQTMVSHCDAQDPKTHACTSTSMKSGVDVLAAAVRTLVDPAANAGLKDRLGSQTSKRNDGTTNPQVTKADLFIEAIKGIDSAFAAAPDGAFRQAKWQGGRSQFVDRFVAVTGTGAQTQFANTAVPAILPVLLQAVQAQILAHCPDRSSAAACTWGQSGLAQDLATTVSGPTFAAVMDLLDAIQQDDAARTQFEKLLSYLLDETSPGEAQPVTLAALVDILQSLNDDNDLTPLYQVIYDAASPALLDDSGNVVKRGLLDAALETLSRTFAPAYDNNGNEVCSLEIDPNQAMPVAMKQLVTPTAPNQPSPIEVLIDVIADVNRAAPGAKTKLAPTDYANMANEVSQFCLDPASGLEQVYQVIHQATQ